MPTSIGRSYSLSLIRGLTAREVSKLKKAGIDTTAELLARATSTRAEHKLARDSGLTLTRTREAVNRADLMQVRGLGAARADLFENAGVNSARELAHRNPAALAKTLERYVTEHPELNYRLPSPRTVASLVARARELVAPAAPLDLAGARAKAAEGLHAYIDGVLFSEDPTGAAFREAVLGWRPSTDWPLVQTAMHRDVAAFVSGAEVSETPEAFTFSGQLYGLYSEVQVEKATDKVGRVYVEID